MSIKRKFYQKGNPENIVIAYQNPSGTLYFYKSCAESENALYRSQAVGTFNEEFTLCDGEPTDEELLAKRNELKDWINEPNKGDIWLDKFSGKEVIARQLCETDISFEGLRESVHAEDGEWVYMDEYGTMHAIDDESFAELYLINTSENKLKIRSKLIREKGEEIHKLREELKEENTKIVAEYCDNDVIATQKAFEAIQKEETEKPKTVLHEFKEAIESDTKSLTAYYISKATGKMVQAHQNRYPRTIESDGNGETTIADPGDYIIEVPGGKIFVYKEDTFNSAYRKATQEEVDAKLKAEPLIVPSAYTKADPEKTEELHDQMKAVDIPNEDVSNFDQKLLDLFVSQLYGKYIHRQTKALVYAYQTRCQQELVGQHKSITAKQFDYVCYCPGGEIKVMDPLQFEKEFEPLSLQHDDRPDVVRYSYGELNPETNKIYFTPMIGTQLVLVHHYEDCYSTRVFLFEVPSGFACDLGDKVLVDTKYGKKEGVVKKVLWKDDLSSAAFDFLIKSSNAKLPLKKVLGKFNYIDFDLEHRALKKANERDEKINQAWQEVVKKHNKWD